MRKAIAITALTAVSLGGVGTLVGLGVPSLAGAQSSTTTAAATSTANGPADHAAFLSSTLAPLVANGTLTQAQADAVIAALEAAHPGDGGPGGRGPGMGPDRMAGPEHLEAVASAIGISADDLRSALDGGQTIAQVAQAHDVSVDSVVKALVTELGSKLDEKVAAGELTQAQADEMKANATQRITDVVNGTMPARPEGGPRGGFGGPGGPGGPGGQRPGGPGGQRPGAPAAAQAATTA